MNSLAEQLHHAGAEILVDTERFCDRAHQDLDRLEVKDKYPVLSDGWLDGLIDPEPVYHFSLDSLIEPLPRAPQQPTQRQRAAVTREVEQAISDAEAAGAVAVAHAEEPIDVFNRRVRAAFAGRNRVGLLELAEQTGEKPNGLLIRLLLGGWRLEQTEFYGEVEVLCPSLGA